MQLGIIKKRLIQNKNILKITKSLKVMSMTRLRSLNEKKQILKNNMPKITTIVEQKIFTTFKKQGQENKNKTINIVFFTDMSFCGTINKRNQNLKLDELENLWIVGNKGRKMNGLFIDKLYGKNLCKNIGEKIQKNIKNIELIKVNLFIGTKTVELFYRKLQDSIEQEYFNCYFYYVLNEYILDFQNEECKTRLMKVTAAINNSEELDEKLKSLYNKTRQQMITSELLELLVSGNN